MCDHRLTTRAPAGENLCVTFLPVIPRVFLMSLSSHFLEFSFSVYDFGLVFLLWEILEMVKIHNFVTSHFNFTTGCVLKLHFFP